MFKNAPFRLTVLICCAKVRTLLRKEMQSMFGRSFQASHRQDSAEARFESASCCASFFAALLLLIDTVIAVSIFVSADIVALLFAVLVFVLSLRVLIKMFAAKRSKPLAA
jgi:hypothetical protein